MNNCEEMLEFYLPLLISHHIFYHRDPAYIPYVWRSLANNGSCAIKPHTTNQPINQPNHFQKIKRIFQKRLSNLALLLPPTPTQPTRKGVKVGIGADFYDAKANGGFGAGGLQVQNLIPLKIRRVCGPVAR
ncbi:hypothetical protein AVEN_261517-1 [Araneus ventricosus]|uniref:Uncharacterized protein n=1 Tax=Araneus ventricosus TaxID=182803 RepID=A0A4Y2SP22_ARAVE|nr:hypothetical protein AVEN_261517-1 [Araneus ventricosus]